MAVTVVTTASNTTAANPLTMVFGSGIQQNDVLFVWCAATTNTATHNPDGTWTKLSGTPIASDSHSQSLMYHVVTAGEAGQTSFSLGNVLSIPAGTAVGVALRGVDTAAIIDSSNTGFDSANSATPSVLPGLTGANLSTGSLVISGVSIDGNRTYTTPSGWTLANSAVGGSNGTATYVWTRDTATTAGTDVASTNVTPSTGDEYCAITLAVTAAATGTTGTMAATTGGAAFSASGEQTQTGTLAAATAAPDLDAAGAMQPAGTLATTIAAPDLDAAGTAGQTYTGTLAATTQAPDLAATAVQTQTGTLAATTSAPDLDAAAVQTQTGTLAAVTQAPDIDAAGVMQPSGTLAATTQAPDLAATGVQTQTGTLAATTQAPDIDAVGAMQPAGTLAAPVQYRHSGVPFCPAREAGAQRISLRKQRI